MDNPILRMLVEKVGNLFSVCIEGERMEGDHTVDLATHCLYFMMVKSINILIGSSIVTFISFDFLSADASIG